MGCDCASGTAFVYPGKRAAWNFIIVDYGLQPNRRMLIVAIVVYSPESRRSGITESRLESGPDCCLDLLLSVVSK